MLSKADAFLHSPWRPNAGSESQETRRTDSTQYEHGQSSVNGLQEEGSTMPYFRCSGCGATANSAAAYSTANVCSNCSAPLPDDAKLVPRAEPARGVHRHAVHEQWPQMSASVVEAVPR